MVQNDKTVFSETDTTIHKKTLLQKIFQFLKFTMFSAGAGIVEGSSFAILELTVQAPVWVYDVISVTLSVLFNFTVNRKFTFKSSANLMLSMLLIGLFYAGFIPLGAFIISTLVNNGLNDFLAKAIKMVLNLVLEFTYYKLVVYRNKENTNIKPR